MLAAVTFKIELPALIIELGVKVALAFFGKPLIVRPTLLLKPYKAPIVTVSLTKEPLFTVSEVEDTAAVKSAGGLLMVILTFAVPIVPKLSVPVNFTLFVPDANGVPEMILPFNCKPLGKPDCVNTILPIPPEVDTLVTGYCVPTVPLLNVALTLTTGAASIVIEFEDNTN